MTAGADPTSFTFAFPDRDGRAAPAPARAPAPTTIGSVISAFLTDAQSGRVQAPGGQPYSRESFREIRAALAHVDSALGHLQIEQLDGERVGALLDELAGDGLAPSRIDSVVLALHRLSAYAGLDGAPALIPAAAAVAPAAAEPLPVTPEPGPPPPRTPTMEMLGAARSVATWTVRATVFLFALVLLLLILEL